MGYDDHAVEEEPSQNADFLSHEWNFEDIWATRRYIRCRESDSGKRVRLENALWRSWAKINHQLHTLPARTLNWEKDSDITWLYGPWKCHNGQLDSSTCKSKNQPLLVPKKSASKKIPAPKQQMLGPRSCYSMLPDKRQQSTKPRAARVSRQPALAYYYAYVFPLARKLRSVTVYVNKIARKITNFVLPSRKPKRYVRFNEAVQQCAIKQLPGEFSSPTCDTGTLLVFSENIVPLPSTTLNSSGEITKTSSSAVANFLEEL